MVAVSATFESERSSAEVAQTMRTRAEKVREVDGLVQTYFIHDPSITLWCRSTRHA
jgi:hypothetical protein